MSERKTVRVRVAVAVRLDGVWSSAGWSSAPNPDELMAFAVEGSDAADELTVGTYWLEADLPIPEQQTFEASVTPEVSP